MQPGIEPKSPGPLANTLTAWPMSWSNYLYYISIIDLTNVSLSYKAKQRTVWLPSKYTGIADRRVKH